MTSSWPLDEHGCVLIVRAIIDWPHSEADEDVCTFDGFNVLLVQLDGSPADHLHEMKFRVTSHIFGYMIGNASQANIPSVIEALHQFERVLCAEIPACPEDREEVLQLAEDTLICIRAMVCLLDPMEHELEALLAQRPGFSLEGPPAVHAWHWFV